MIPWRPYWHAWMSLTPEALWIPEVACTLAAGRCATLPDLSLHSHDLTQAGALKPLWDATGASPMLIFDVARGDYMANATAIAIGTNPYTLLAVYRYRSLAVGDLSSRVLLQNTGTYGTDGFTYCQMNHPLGSQFELLYHTGANLKFSATQVDTTLRSTIMRHDGANLLWRRKGVDDASVAMAAQLTPTGGLSLSSATVSNRADMDFYMAAVFLRSLSAADLATAQAIITQHYGAGV